MKINRNFDNLVPNYLFADVARKTAEYAAANPDKKIIRLGIGDVTLPLAPVVVEAMKQGAEELAHKETFKGYPEYEGYDFLREAISGYYKSFGVSVSPDEIFVSEAISSHRTTQSSSPIPFIPFTSIRISWRDEKSSTPPATNKTVFPRCPTRA